MALTTEQIALYTGYLTAARAAYHSLALGKSVRVVVDQNGERVEYSPANRSALAAYIKELERLLGLPGTVVGPLHTWF